MLCSVCNKNTAVIFINKTENGKSSVEGLCYACAKKKGINPLEVLTKNANLSSEEFEDMSNQFENILKDFSENMNLEELGIDPTTMEEENGQNPLSGILGFFKAPNNSENEQSASAESAGAGQKSC